MRKDTGSPCFCACAGEEAIVPLRVFISHATENVAFAEQLARDLRRAGADVWLDTSHIGPGDFVARISEALNNRDVLVLVLSPAALRSQWVPDEVNAAIVRYKQGFMQAPVIVLAQPVSLRDIPGVWTVYHRIDATREYGDALPHIVQALKLTMPQQAPTTLPPTPQAAPSVPAPVQGEQMRASWTVSRRKLLAMTGAGVAFLATAGGAAWLILSQKRDTTSLHPQRWRWQFHTGNTVHSSPTVVNGVVYVGSWDDYLYAVDAATGTQRWRFPTGGQVIRRCMAQL